MTEKPTKRGPSERPRERTAGEPTDLEGAPDEGYGLLVMARHVKDDGRALIIYTRAGDPPE